jgi:hypothetical protein
MDAEQRAERQRREARAAFRRRMRLLLLAPRDEIEQFNESWRPVTDAIRDRHVTDEDEPRAPGIANL